MFCLNIIIPPIFDISRGLFKNKYKCGESLQDPQFIVSLTSFPARINKVWLTIETILRQKDLPDKILLWLSSSDFPDKNSLPRKLLQLEKRGLNIRFCTGDLMPHKKYFYTILEYPEANVITVDDDMFYSPDLLLNLKKHHLNYPKDVICSVARRIRSNGVQILPYTEWEYISVNTKPTFSNQLIGAGGTLFPPHSLHLDTFDKDRLKEMALKADDLWLKIMSVRNHTRIVSIAGEFPRLSGMPIKFKNESKLMDLNIGHRNNDRVFNDLLRYYDIPISIFKQD